MKRIEVLKAVEIRRHVFEWQFSDGSTMLIGTVGARPKGKPSQEAAIKRWYKDPTRVSRIVRLAVTSDVGAKDE